MFRLSLVFAMDEAKVKEIIAQNNRDLLGQIKDLVSTSISDLKRSNDSNAAEQMSEIKRLKRDAPPSFKKKSNEEQFKANKSVMEAVEDASVALERKDLLRTKEALDRGMSLLKDRQKLILLADKSPYGWTKPFWNINITTWRMMKKTRRRSIELKRERLEPRNASLHVVWDYSADLEYLSQEIRSSPSAKFLIPLLGSINSFPLADLPDFAFPVENLDIGGLPARMFFPPPILPTNRQSD